jgi:hypothetical protein
MENLRSFVQNISKETQLKKNFLQFIVTGNKPVLSELILSELIKELLREKDRNLIRLDVLDHVQTNSENKIFFGLNKKKTNNQFLIYDLYINTNKKDNNLYIFENKSQKIKESLSLKKIENFVCLQINQELKELILEENRIIKIPNNDIANNLIKKFGFDWIFKTNFIRKINFYGNSSSYYYSLQYLKNLDENYKLLFSKNFVSFTASRSDDEIISSDNEINFYGNSEAFLNFFDENPNCFHLTKLNIGESKFNEAIQKLDTLCMEKQLNTDNKFKTLNFAIQSGMVLL